MATITVYIDDCELDVTYYINPEEKQTRDCPGHPVELCIEGVTTFGQEISGLIEELGGKFDKIEELIWESLEDDKYPDGDADDVTARYGSARYD